MFRNIAEIINIFERKLFSQIIHPGHCLYHLLPPITPGRCCYSLRERQHSFQLSNIELLQIKNSFINRCLFKFRWLHSALQSDVLSEFCTYCSSRFYVLLMHSICNNVRMTCLIKRLLIFIFTSIFWLKTLNKGRCLLGLMESVSCWPLVIITCSVSIQSPCEWLHREWTGENWPAADGFPAWHYWLTIPTGRGHCSYLWCGCQSNCRISPRQSPSDISQCSTAVRTVVRATQQVNGKWPFSGCQNSVTPEPID